MLLGASNLTRAFSTVVGMALATYEGPLSILAAMGHGRSFGQESCFLGKKISGIFQCGIWKALERDKEIPTIAYVTDIGNDLAYELPVERIVQRVRECVDRLQTIGARVIVCDLPLDVLRGVGATRYRLFRTLLFPACRLNQTEMIGRAEQLSQRLQELAESRKTPLFKGKSEWYGWDPIHLRRASYKLLWAELLSMSDVNSETTPQRKKSLPLVWYLHCLRPESWSSFSFPRRANQPNGRLMDGTEVSLY